MSQISKHVRATLTTGAVLAGAVIPSAASAQALPDQDPAAITAGRGASSQHSCGGLQIDKTAPVISTGDIFLRASRAHVYALQTDVDNWSSWRPDVAYATRLEPGRLKAGSSFRWETGGITVVSTVQAVRPGHCTIWGGPGSGIDGVHLWTYTTVPGGVLVHTEESWSGPLVDANAAGLQVALDDSLATWRADLKRTAEVANDPSSWGYTTTGG